MHTIRVTFTVCIAEGRVPDPTNPSNYGMAILDAIREDGIIMDTQLNACGVPGERSYPVEVVIVE